MAQSCTFQKREAQRRPKQAQPQTRSFSSYVSALQVTEPSPPLRVRPHRRGDCLHSALLPLTPHKVHTAATHPLSVEEAGRAGERGRAGLADPQDRERPCGRGARWALDPGSPPSVSLLSPGGGRLHGSSPAARQRASHSGNTAPLPALSCSAQFAFKQVSFHLFQGSGERRDFERAGGHPGVSERPRLDRGGPGTILGVAEHTQHRAGVATQVPALRFCQLGDLGKPSLPWCVWRGAVPQASLHTCLWPSGVLTLYTFSFPVPVSDQHHPLLGKTLPGGFCICVCVCVCVCVCCGPQLHSKHFYDP